MNKIVYNRLMCLFQNMLLSNIMTHYEFQKLIDDTLKNEEEIMGDLASDLDNANLFKEALDRIMQ
jgi:hypothetical protein